MHCATQIERTNWGEGDSGIVMLDRFSWQSNGTHEIDGLHDVGTADNQLCGNHPQSDRGLLVKLPKCGDAGHTRVHFACQWARLNGGDGGA
jgi:hypothetical protein